LLELLPRAGGPLLGLVTSDHAGAGALLAANRVLIAGQHGDAVAPRDGKWARIHLVTREVGLAAVRRSRRALAVASGNADVGLTTHAWASRAGLEFQALGSETYDLLITADRLGDPAVVALCELLQSAELRKQLRTRFGYGVSKTGELRVG
jgi:hypothetical protein